MAFSAVLALFLVVAHVFNPSESATAVDDRSLLTRAESTSATGRQVEEGATAKGTNGPLRDQSLQLPFHDAFEVIAGILRNLSIIVEPPAIATNQTLSNAFWGVSQRCLNETQFMLENLQSPWGQAMLDSFGRQPSGILRGNLKWLGDFDECVGAKSDSSYAISVSGRFCMAPIPITHNGKQEIAYTAGCVPSGCDGSDLKIIVVEALRSLGQIPKNGTVEGFVVNCQPSRRTLDAAAIVATAVLSFFVLLLVAGTIYDVSTDAYICLLKDFCGESTRSTLAAADLSAVQLHPMTNSIGADFAQPMPQSQSHSATLKEDADHNNNGGPKPVQVGNGESRHSNNIPPVSPDSGQISPQSAQLAKGGEHAGFQNRGVARKILLSFSIYTNGKKLLNTAKGDPTLSSLNGIRFLSMCWVLLGHTYLYSANVLSGFKTFMSEGATNISFQAIANAGFAVDSFFLLSSILVSYLLLRELEKRKGSLSLKGWILIYVHRYTRLTGVYAVLLMIYVGLAFYLYDGPQWPTNGTVDGPCLKYWWANLVYINNFIEEKPGVSCMPWTWYLANDMQMFLIAPVLIYITYKAPYVGVSITALLTFGSVVSAAIIAKDNSMTMSIAMQLDPAFSSNLTSKLFFKPWNRFQAYGVGIILGYILYKVKGNFKTPKILGLIGWILAAGCCLSALYGPYDIEIGSRVSNHSVAEASIYTALCRLSWAVGVAWVVFACGTGNGGWVGTLLSWTAFTPLARLCYCTYLVHPIIMTIMQQGGRDMIHFDHLTMIVRFLGQAVISMALAFVTSLAFEAPLLGIEKTLFKAAR